MAPDPIFPRREVLITVGIPALTEGTGASLPPWPWDHAIVRHSHICVHNPANNLKEILGFWKTGEKIKLDPNVFSNLENKFI